MSTATRTIDQTEPIIGDAAVETLRAKVRGTVLAPHDTGYDDARALWNAMIDKRPALIVRASGTADAADTVRFAREHDLPLAVRGGGHNIAGTALCDGGVVLDLSALKGVELDRRTGLTRVQPGCVWGDVDRETQPAGLAVPNGIVSTTGVAGLTLGGGFGWTSRRFGYTSDRLRAAEVVTADGEVVRADADDHPDLFWALRGGGGNFGAVTAFAFEAQPFGPEVLGGMRLYPMARAAEVVDAFKEMTAAAPEALTSLLVLRHAPAAPALPAELHGAPVAIVAVCFEGDDAEGERALAPLDRLGPPLVDLIGRKPFRAVQTMLDASSPHGRQYYWKSDYFHELSDAAVDPLLDHAGRMTSTLSAVLFMHLGGAANRLSADHSAAGPRDVGYVLNIQGAWLDPAETPTHEAWVKDYWAAMHPHSSGRAYANFFTADEGPERVRAAYGAERFAQLARIKARYDPTNLFRSNQNIPPDPLTRDAKS